MFVLDHLPINLIKPLRTVLRKQDEDPVTLAAVRIRGKNKKLIKELFQAFLILVAMLLFFTTCWGVDRYLKKEGLHVFDRSKVRGVGRSTNK